MHAFLFRSRDLILESDEADLVRDVCLDLDKAEKKLKAIRRRLQGVQERAATQVQLPFGADTKKALSNFYDWREQQKRETAGNYWIGIQFTPCKTISKIRSYHER